MAILLICNYKPLSRGLYDSILPLIILLWIPHSVEFKHNSMTHSVFTSTNQKPAFVFHLNLGIYNHYVYTPWSAQSTEVFWGGELCQRSYRKGSFSREMHISSSIWHTFLKLVDGPMRRQMAIRWTNRKTAGAVWACATQIEMHRIRGCFRPLYRCPMMCQEEKLNFDIL